MDSLLVIIFIAGLIIIPLFLYNFMSGQYKKDKEEKNNTTDTENTAAD